MTLPDSGVLRPATPPADFDLDQALTSLQRFRDRNPQGLALAHYGLQTDPAALLEEAQDTLRQWAVVAEKAWREQRDIAEALEQAFGDGLGAVPQEHRQKLETLNGIHSNAAGLKVWLEKTKAAPHEH